jgi:Basic region leucine zipper
VIFAHLGTFLSRLNGPSSRFLFQVYVADSEKNEEYWAKRVKNNVAARRSREARRLKENQVNTYSRDAIVQGALW